MQFDDLLTDDAVLEELGRRLQQQRLARNLTQDQLADAAGVGRATLQRIERGRSAQATALVKVLRALGLLGGLDTLLPVAVESPIAELERQRRRGRRRARGRRGAAAGPHSRGKRGGAADPSAPDAEPWRWGEDAEHR
ncbi:MAG TPA: helix-turn-helix transcriptional regulator [Solirubrobacteraceae bacterium]|jgi:transcriptional regulator with XRE-family HTH domain|nr:helix-turn-helix transcriptional regulator [Solirubrobacteraceae bacterium]